MSGHTPGPWHRIVGRYGNGGASSQHEQLCNSAGIAAVMLEHDGSDEGVANANLIAAAPELLAALKGVRGHICWCLVNIGHPSAKEHSDACLEAIAAIRKAEGDEPCP